MIKLVSKKPGAVHLFFSLSLSMRMGEIPGLTWDRLDMKNRLIYLDKTKRGDPRYVALCQTAADILEGSCAGDDEGHVFINKRTGRPCTKSMKSSYERAKKMAGIEGLTFHDLRHVFASRLRRRGASLGDIAEALGHKSITMTLRYAHLSPDYMGSVVRVLDGPDEKAKEKRNWDDSWTIRLRKKRAKLQIVEK